MILRYLYLLLVPEDLNVFMPFHSYHVCQSDSTTVLLVHKDVKLLFNFPFNTHVANLE